MLRLYDHILPNPDEVFTAMEKYANAPTNKMAKTQCRILLERMSGGGSSEFMFYAQDAEVLLKEFRANLGGYRDAVTKDVDTLLRSAQVSLAPRKNRPAPKINNMAMVKQMPKAIAALPIFNAVVAACSSENKLILIKKETDPHDKSNFILKIEGKFSNYKKLFLALVEELGYETKDIRKNQSRGRTAE